MQAYHIIRTLLIQNNKIPKDRICFKDQKTAFNITLDDNQRKTICKLIFNDKIKKIVIDNKEYLLEDLDSIMKLKKELNDHTISLV